MTPPPAVPRADDAVTSQEPRAPGWRGASAEATRRQWVAVRRSLRLEARRAGGPARPPVSWGPPAREDKDKDKEAAAGTGRSGEDGGDRETSARIEFPPKAGTALLQALPATGLTREDKDKEAAPKTPVAEPEPAWEEKRAAQLRAAPAGVCAECWVRRGRWLREGACVCVHPALARFSIPG